MKRNCDNCRHTKKDVYEQPCSHCVALSEWEALTNADRIRAMTDEELARFLGQHSLCSRVERCPDHGKCHKCVLDWLKQPKEGADHVE